MSPIEMARRFSGLPCEEIWQVLAGEFGFTQPEGFLDQIRVEYEKHCETELQAIHGVVDTIEAIVRLGHLICVASSTPRPRLERNLKRTGLFNAFVPHIYSASQVSRAKPAPDVLLYAASQMGADPHECTVIEDSVIFRLGQVWRKPRSERAQPPTGTFLRLLENGQESEFRGDFS